MIFQELQELHKDFTLTGKYPNELLDANSDLLNYLFGLLKDEFVEAPDVSLNEWKDFLDSLSPHGILPLLYYKLKKMPALSYPPNEIFSNMQNVFMASCARSMRMENYFKEVASAFKSENIDFIVLKGLAYARAYYPDPATRPYADIDVLIDKKRILQAHDVLSKLGYSCTKLNSDRFMMLENENGYMKKFGSNYIIIDLHYGMYSLPGVIKSYPFNQYFDNCVSLYGKSGEIRLLNPVDSLINSAIHGCITHNIEIRLIWIYDINAIIKNFKNAEWENLKYKCLLNGSRIAVESVLRISDVWTGTSALKIFISNDLPSKKELKNFRHALKRHKSLISWFNIRWPKKLSIIEQLRLIINYRDVLCNKIKSRLKRMR